ncbi:hypothetical protein GOV11_04900, partial [Candidatus Woesearchaeota archaeon]|nr:hypothetical protein [Candidatus Woesearchaeota archaeon]
KNLLVVESVINDLVVITAASVLITFVTSGGFVGQAIAGLFLNEILASTVFGILVGIAWVFLYVYKLHGNKLSYIFTVGVAFMLYFLVEYLSFNGAIAVVLFSITIANHPYVVRTFRVKTKLFNSIDQDISSVKRADIEFTFLIRTFFFVLLGIVIDIQAVLKPRILYLVIIVLGLELIARFVSSLSMWKVRPSFRNALFIRTTMVAIGVPSVLAVFLGIQAGLNISSLTEIVLLLVILTNITAIIGTSIQERRTNAIQENKDN